MFDDDYDPIFKQVLGGSSDEPLVTTLRAAVAAVAAVVEEERDDALTPNEAVCGRPRIEGTTAGTPSSGIECVGIRASYELRAPGNGSIEWLARMRFPGSYSSLIPCSRL